MSIDFSLKIIVDNKNYEVEGSDCGNQIIFSKITPTPNHFSDKGVWIKKHESGNFDYTNAEFPHQFNQVIEKELLKWATDNRYPLFATKL